MATPSVIVEPPQITPRKFGLYSVAERMAAKPHELIGIEHENINCGAVDRVYLQNLDDGILCVKPATSGWRGGTDYVTAAPFVLVGSDACSGVNEFAKAKDTAVRRLNAGEERGAETGLWSMLAKNLTAEVDAGNDHTLKQAIAMLEEHADYTYDGVPTFHFSRQAFSLAASSDFIRQHGNQMQTNIGSPAYGAVGLGYSGYAPGQLPPDPGESYLWVTGKVTVRYGQSLVQEPHFVMKQPDSEGAILNITGSPTGGTFRLTFSGQQTATIAYNASDVTIQTALEALSNIDPGDVTVSDLGGGQFVINFGGQYTNVNVPDLVVSSSALTGGTAPLAAITMFDENQGVPVNNFGDNTYETLAQKPMIVSYDCYVAAIKFTLPS